MIRLVVFWIALCAAAAPLEAQVQRTIGDDEDGLSVRGVGFVSRQQFAAKTTFDAVFGESAGRFFGGGVQVAEGGVFLEVLFSRFTRTGQRAYLFNGTAYPLNIPLTATVTPFEITGGYQFRRHTSIIPYAGAGVGSYAYKETSSFSGTGDDVDARHAGYLLVGGAEFRMHRLIGIAAHLQYSHIPGILGTAGLSKEANESDLGGMSIHAKIIVGVGH